MAEKIFENAEFVMEFLFRSLPAEDEQMEALYKLIAAIADEPGHAVHLTLADHDDPREFHIAYEDGGYKVVLSFPMDDFGWPNPLLLAGEHLPLGDVIDILDGICRQGMETGDFEIIYNGFHNITESVYGDFSDRIVDPDGGEDEDGGDDEETDEYAEYGEYIDVLKEIVHRYYEKPGSDRYVQILMHLFNGIADNMYIPVLVDPESTGDDGELPKPQFIVLEDGTELAAGNLDESLEDTMRFPLRYILSEMLKKRDVCSGLILHDEDENNLHISLGILMAGIRVGSVIAHESMEDEDGDEEEEK